MRDASFQAGARSWSQRPSRQEGSQDVLDFVCGICIAHESHIVAGGLGQGRWDPDQSGDLLGLGLTRSRIGMVPHAAAAAAAAVFGGGAHGRVRLDLGSVVGRPHRRIAGVRAGRILRDNRDGRKDLDGLPWFVQMSLYLYKLDRVSATKKPGRGSDINLRPWLDSLPRTMATPIHWNAQARDELQYETMVRSVRQQEITWKESYFAVAQKLVGPALTWEQFLWGAEMARSRAFSGAYTGRPFNPFLYAFTLLLVAACSTVPTFKPT
jgi:hypothetical protein